MAGLLSLSFPGLGHLYLDKVKQAIAFAVISEVSLIAYWLLIVNGLMESLGGLIAASGFLLVLVSIVIWAAVSAFRQARIDIEIRPRWYTKWYALLGVWLLGQAWGYWYEYMGGVTVATYSIPAQSMHPNLLVGDYLVAEKNAFRSRLPKRGEIAVFKLGDGKTDYIKRVIGLPGDRVQLVDGRLRINGKVVEREKADTPADFDTWLGQQAQSGRPYVDTKSGGIYREMLSDGPQYLVREETDQGHVDNTSEFKVPDVHFFVLGDNRDRSKDSRYFEDGPFVPVKNLRDRPIYLYWSENLSRIGKSIR
ncbi:MAG: signal peptidase I [Magnetovibrio sp.]|nr:signal peptidase I [Magnetovibrio sp.]